MKKRKKVVKKIRQIKRQKVIKKSKKLKKLYQNQKR